MKTVFKKGMTVYWGELKGEVSQIYQHGDFPINVYFSELNIYHDFTTDGRLYLSHPILLSLTPYTLNGFSQEPQIEKDSLVYYRDNKEQNWAMVFIAIIQKDCIMFR